MKYIKTAIIFFSFEFGIFFWPGKNKEPITACFETPKLAYNSFKKTSHFPGALLIFHLVYNVPMGLWEIPAHASLFEIYKHCFNNEPINKTQTITFIAGKTKYEIMEQINSCDSLSGPKINDLEEGSVFANTYHFKTGLPRKKLINTAQKYMQKTRNELWKMRPLNFPLTQNEWVILASIVEKEGRTKNEFIKIAECFLARLQKNMRLQSCATVLYGLNQKRTKLYYKDLFIKTNYNTYRKKNLPNTPICTPSLDALNAVLNAKLNSPYLFFFHDGTNLTLSKTFSEHINNQIKNKKAQKLTVNSN